MHLLKYRAQFFIFLLAVFPYIANAQVISNNGRFSVDYALGCVPFTVEVQEIGDLGDEPPQYFFEGVVDIDTIHTYFEPGIDTIIQFIQDPTGGNEDKLDTLIVRIVEDIEPEFDLFYCESQTVFLEITDQTYDAFIVTFEPGENDTLTVGRETEYTYAGNGSHTISVQGLYENGAPNCSPGSRTIELLSPNQPATINDVNFERICADNSTMNIDYQSDSLQYYEVALSEDGQPYETIYEGQLNSNLLVLSELDLNTSPGTVLCIRINAVSRCSGTITQGEEFCLTIASTTFSSIQNAYASHGANGIQFFFNSEENGVYILSRQSSGNQSFLSDTISSGFVDTSISPYRRYSYQIAYYDACDQLAEEVSIAPPYMRLTKRKSNRYTVGWEAPLTTLDVEPSYQLKISNLTNSEIDTTISNPDNPYQITLSSSLGKRQVIQIDALYSDLGFSSKSNVGVLSYELIVYVPTAFSPDNDGLNDELELFGVPENFVKMTIYNRWGKVIHEITDRTDSWDGRVGNSQAQEGTYLYMIEFFDTDGQKMVQHGSFALIRKS